MVSYEAMSSTSVRKCSDVDMRWRSCMACMQGLNACAVAGKVTLKPADFQPPPILKRNVTVFGEAGSSAELDFQQAEGMFTVRRTSSIAREPLRRLQAGVETGRLASG